MIKPDQKITIKWNPRNKNRLVSLGYKFTAMGDDITIDINDAPKRGHYTVKVICDYCGKEFEMTLTNYFKSSKDRDEVACNNCKTIKTRERLMERYGVNAPNQCKQFLEKAKQTNLDRYGVVNPMQNHEIQQRNVATLMERYGVDSPSKLPQHAESMKLYDKESAKAAYKETCLERYGVDNTSKLQFVKDKAFNTCLERYGGGSSQCSEEVRAKTIESMRNGGNISTSRPEREMVKMLQEIYGDENCIPQYVLSHISMDCLLIVGDVKIDVEYDGKFWHDIKKDKDMRRDHYCRNQGYKVLRFRGGLKPPTEEQIKNGVNYLVNSEREHLIVDI